MVKAALTGTGVFIAPCQITNDELVESFNRYVHDFNTAHANEIAAGTCEALAESSSAFIEKASGIQARYVMEKTGILDIKRMRPLNLERPTEEISLQAEMGMKAAQEAIKRANIDASEIDMVICACANMQRPYPAIAIEVQQAIGAGGYAFDLNVACSSATFGLKTAYDAISNGTAKTVLMVNPEVCSAQLDYRERDSHFIFGDACSAVILQDHSIAKSKKQFEIKSTFLKTQFSNNIRSNGGFLNRTDIENRDAKDKYFTQQGRKVFKEVVPMVSEIILSHLSENKLTSSDIKRFWLHQANAHMNQVILERVLGRESDQSIAPIILNEFANTSSAGSVIAFHRNHDDLKPGDLGLLCSFGAGYSVGSILLACLS